MRSMDHEQSGPPPELVRDREIAEALPGAWDAFFASFGRLTEVQRQVIPLVLAGRNVLACAPTASGKTEAVCAPLMQRLAGQPRPWTVLYVSPTRALVNDLYERLSAPLGRMSVGLARRTGDHKDVINQHHMVLLTTPESFDSLLCRGRNAEVGHILARVEAVALDEIHLLAGNQRGEQTRWLLHRLALLRRYAKGQGWVSSDALQLLGLSATLPDPAAVACRYLGFDAQAVEVAGSRAIETVTVSAGVPTIEKCLPAYLTATADDEKVLVFCNSRKRVDELAVWLRREMGPLAYQVRAHHGSLSKVEREGTEAAVKESRRIVVVATSTLEIGVDIGDIDLVVLDGPAPDVSALLQRIGRGNRRTRRTRVMACASSLSDAVIHAAMVEAARRRDLGPCERGPSFAVARQQLASYIFQGPKRARPRGKLEELLRGMAVPLVSERLLDHLIANGELLESGDGIRLGDLWLERAERGSIHSNIESGAGATVIDETSGAEIASDVRFSGGFGLKAAGKLLEARRWCDRKLEVRETSEELTATGSWGYVSRAWIKGIGQPDAVRRYLEIGIQEWPLLCFPDRVLVFHFGGGRRQAIIDLLIGYARISHEDVRVNEWLLRLPAASGVKPEWLTAASSMALQVQIRARLDALERTLGRPAANKCLPDEAREAEVREWLRLDEELAAIAAAAWVEPDDDDTRRVLRLLANDMGY